MLVDTRSKGRSKGARGLSGERAVRSGGAQGSAASSPAGWGSLPSTRAQPVSRLTVPFTHNSAGNFPKSCRFLAVFAAVNESLFWISIVEPS